MKFAEEYFDEIKAGTILIFIDNSDDEFTKGSEYEVKEDEEGLYVVEDGQFNQLFNEVLAKYFVIKEPDTAEIQARLQQAEADCAVMREALELGKKACASMSCNAPDSSGCNNLCYAYNFRIASDKILNNTDAGAALLKELEELRKVAEAARKYYRYDVISFECCIKELEDSQKELRQALTELYGSV